jgi:chemotaxis protein CheY-P-specific phosphatase CheC
MSMTLTKAELADLMFEKVGLNKREAKDMVESFFEEIRMAISSFATSRSARVATQKQGKKSPSPRAA